MDTTQHMKRMRLKKQEMDMDLVDFADNIMSQEDSEEEQDDFAPISENIKKLLYHEENEEPKELPKESNNNNNTSKITRVVSERKNIAVKSSTESKPKKL
jgi:hypothetical protein